MIHVLYNFIRFLIFFVGSLNRFHGPAYITLRKDEQTYEIRIF